MFRVISDIFRKASEAVGIEWAPLNVPMARRLQTLAATGWVCLALFGQGTLLYLFIKLLYSEYWWLGILYAGWMLNDIDVCHKGGRPIQWVRNWRWWVYFSNYFPIKLVKTTDLDPSKNYLFACYPHGLLPTGAFCSFGANALNFDKLFPGLTPYLIGLGGHFLFPFFREIILSLGGCASSKESLLYLLDPKKFHGNCVAVAVGGAAETLYSHPGEYKIILKRRKGFIRIAMTTGASLVPVFSFGETDVYRPPDNPEGSLFRRFQEKVRDVFGSPPIFLIGRGIFQYSFGILPLRRPVTTVVGTPIAVKKNLDPTNEEVDSVHAEFTKRLVQLFDSEKSKYLKNYQEVQLVIT